MTEQEFRFTLDRLDRLEQLVRDATPSAIRIQQALADSDEGQERYELSERISLGLQGAVANIRALRALLNPSDTQPSEEDWNP